MTALPASIDLLLIQAEAEKREAAELLHIRSAQAGDMKAFEWIVQQHEARLFGFCCRWLRCEEDAREVCQDAFVRAWQALPEYEHRSKLSTWLYQITLNLCRDRAKSRAFRQQESTRSLQEEIPSPICPQPPPDASAQWRSDMQKLERGLATLPKKLSEVLLLTAMEGLSHEECAEVLGCSLRGIEGRVYRARRLLLRWWDDGL